MQVKEKCVGLFTEMKNISPSLPIFDFIDDDTLNQLYIMKYGNRELTSNVVDVDVTLLARVLIRTYGFKWDNMVLNLTNSIKELAEYNELITETITDEGSLHLMRENINKVTAYNVDDFVNNSSDDNSETNTTNNLKKRQYEIKKLKDIKVYERVHTYLNKTNICDIIFMDINQLLTTKVF